MHTPRWVRRCRRRRCELWGTRCISDVCGEHMLRAQLFAGLAAGWGHTPPFVSSARSSGLPLDLTAACAPTLLLRTVMLCLLHLVSGNTSHATSKIGLLSAGAQTTPLRVLGCLGVLRRSRRRPCLHGRGTRSKMSRQPEPRANEAECPGQPDPHASHMRDPLKTRPSSTWNTRPTPASSQYRRP